MPYESIPDDNKELILNPLRENMNVDTKIEIIEKIKDIIDKKYSDERNIGKKRNTEETKIKVICEDKILKDHNESVSFIIIDLIFYIEFVSNINYDKEKDDIQKHLKDIQTDLRNLVIDKSNLNLVENHCIEIYEHIYKQLVTNIKTQLKGKTEKPYRDLIKSEDIKGKILLDLITDDQCERYKELVTSNEAVDAVRTMGTVNVVNNLKYSTNTENKKEAVAVAFKSLKARLIPPQKAEAVAFKHLKAKVSHQQPEKIVELPKIIDSHPDSLFRSFKQIIEEISNKYEIESVFDKTDSEFQKTYEDLSRTKLSKKEKIKILYLCGFDYLREFAGKFQNIYNVIYDYDYIKNILINYLKQNQHMIAIGMYNNENGPDTKKPKSSLEIDFKYNNYDHFFNVKYKEDGNNMEEKIPLETQLIYLLHNVIMD